MLFEEKDNKGNICWTHEDEDNDMHEESEKELIEDITNNLDLLRKLGKNSNDSMRVRSKSRFSKIKKMHDNRSFKDDGSEGVCSASFRSKSSFAFGGSA